MDSDFMSRSFYANGEIKSTLFRSPGASRHTLA